MPTNIIIADDHQLFIEGLQSLLSDQSDLDISIIAIAKDGKQLLDILHELHNENKQYGASRERVDVILLDQGMPIMNGLEAIRYIKMAYSDLKIIMLTQHDEPYLIQKAMDCGASGYLPKDCTQKELLDCIKNVMNNVNHFPQKSARVGCTSLQEENNFLKRLTKTELELIPYFKEGLTNKQIAEKLHRSIETIETHHKNINRKFGVNSPAALVKFIIENRL